MSDYNVTVSLGGVPEYRKYSDKMLSSISVLEDSGCWEWSRGMFDNGYGQACAFNRPIKAHRLSYLVFVGPIMGGQCVLHRCDNKKCVNPDHLCLGTNGDNSRDMVAKSRSASGERNARAILTADSVARMRYLYATGNYTQKQIASAWGVSQQTVSAVATGTDWRSGVQNG